MEKKKKKSGLMGSAALKLKKTVSKVKVIIPKSVPTASWVWVGPVGWEL